MINKSFKKIFNKEYLLLLLILIFGTIIRLILIDKTGTNDAASFYLWSKFLTQNKISDLYESLPFGYLPYPPLYYYILKVLGYLIQILNAWNNHWLAYLLIRSPILTAELITALLIFKISKGYLNVKKASICAGFYFLHPVIIYNSMIWGQIDSVIIMFSLLSLVLIHNRKIYTGLIIYASSVLIKLQSLAILPLILYLLWYFPEKRKIVKAIVVSVIFGISIFFPILITKGILWTVQYFIQLPNQYPYTSVYAYNIWSMFGFMVPDNLKIGIIPYKYLGIGLFWLVAGFILIKLKNNSKLSILRLVFAGFLLYFDFAYFSTRMHSRYFIYSLGFIAPFFIAEPFICIMLSILIFLNLMLPNNNLFWLPLTSVLNSHLIIILFSLITLSLFIFSFKKYQKMKYL